MCVVLASTISATFLPILTLFGDLTCDINSSAERSFVENVLDCYRMWHYNLESKECRPIAERPAVAWMAPVELDGPIGRAVLRGLLYAHAGVGWWLNQRKSTSLAMLTSKWQKGESVVSSGQYHPPAKHRKTRKYNIYPTS